MKLGELAEYKKQAASSYKEFGSLKVRTTSGFEGYLHVITKRTAVLTPHKCSPELGTACELHRVVGTDFDDKENWEVLVYHGTPLENYEPTKTNQES